MIHTVVLKSIDNLDINGNGNIITFSMDWAFLKDNTKYKLKAYFTSNHDTNLSADDLVNIEADFLGSSTVYEAGGKRSGFVKSNYLTTVSPQILHTTSGGTAGYRMYLKNDNTPCVMLNSKPLGSTFNVYLRNAKDNSLLGLSADFRYVLVLEFTEY
jgi:hypothetical protein